MFFPRTQTVSLFNGQLFMNALPLIPQSETTFETETAVIAFVMDSGGQVAHLVLTQLVAKTATIANVESAFLGSGREQSREP